MKLIRHSLTRNILAWREGTYTLEILYRGSKEELMQKLKEALEKELNKDA